MLLEYIHKHTEKKICVHACNRVRVCLCSAAAAVASRAVNNNDDLCTKHRINMAAQSHFTRRRVSVVVVVFAATTKPPLLCRHRPRYQKSSPLPPRSEKRSVNNKYTRLFKLC